jgi:positive regulator of sigma E activity
MKIPYPIALLVGFVVMVLLLRLFAGERWSAALTIALIYTAFTAAFDWIKSRRERK